jgi:hypothetical protein
MIEFFSAHAAIGALMVLLLVGGAALAIIAWVSKP